jgi:hypothetical protein
VPLFLGTFNAADVFWFPFPDLQVVETSRMMNGSRMHLSSISSLMAKGLNTYVNTFFYIKGS